MYLNELFGNKVTQFHIKKDSCPGEKRDFANFGELGDEPNLGLRIEHAIILPDSLALDAEGAVWIADTLNQRAVRIAEGGDILETIDTAPDGIFAVTLGGHNGKTLFMCTAPDWDESSRKAETKGRMLAVQVKVGHAGTP